MDASRVGAILAVSDEAASFLAGPYEPPWRGCRFFFDPDGYLLEVEQPA